MSLQETLDHQRDPAFRHLQGPNNPMQYKAAILCELQMASKSHAARELSGSSPIYMQISEHLKRQLRHLDGVMHVRLPTEVELVRKFGVSRQTARRAYEELVSQGLVVRSRGKGTFPSRHRPFRMSVASVDDLLSPPTNREVRVLTPLTLRRSTAAATKLGLPGDEVAFIAYQHVHDGKPFALNWIYLPPHIGPLLADEEFLHKQGGVGIETVVTMLDRKLQHPVALAKQLVTAVAASADVAAAIECLPHQPVLEIEYVYFDSDARPVEWSVNFFNPQLYEYRAQLQRRSSVDLSPHLVATRSNIPDAPDVRAQFGQLEGHWRGDLSHPAVS